MARLTAAQRRKLPKSDFAGGGDSYPVPDKSHARFALAMAAKHAGPALKAKVRAKVKSKFPGIKIEGHKSGGRLDRHARS